MAKEFSPTRCPGSYQFAGLTICGAVIFIITYVFNLSLFNLIAIFSLLLSTLSNSNFFSKDKRTLKDDDSRMIDWFTVISYSVAIAIINVKAYQPTFEPQQQVLVERWVIGVISAMSYLFLFFDALTTYLKNKRKDTLGLAPVNKAASEIAMASDEEFKTEFVVVKCGSMSVEKNNK